MSYKEWRKNITLDDKTNACFAGTRVTVAQVAKLAQQGVTYNELFGDFPFLTTQDIRYAVMYYNNAPFSNL